MAGRRRKTGFEVVVEALAGLPWTICLLLVPFAWLLFHRMSLLATPAAQSVGQLGPSIAVTLFKLVGMAMQYLAPAALLLAALGSWTGSKRRHRLLADAQARTSDAPLMQLSWRDFEQLVGAHFEREGYTVRFTPDSADGGIDLIARKGSETFLIQCKQWRATQVGVSVVRELYGVMAARGATGGYVVSIGAYTQDARAFATGRNITLLDARTLIQHRKPTAPRLTPAADTSNQDAAPDCPQCGSAMKLRTAKQGANKGKEFYGCSRYPECRGTRAADG